MADTAISALASASALDGTEVFPVVQSATTKKTAISTIATYLTGAGFLISGGALGTPSSGNLANCTFPTLNQNTSGTAGGLSATLAVTSGGTGLTSYTANRFVYSSGATALASFPAVVLATSGTLIQIVSQAATDVPLEVKMATSQSGVPLRIRDVNNSDILSVAVDGAISITRLAPQTSGTAITFQSTAGNAIGFGPDSDLNVARFQANHDNGMRWISVDKDGNVAKNIDIYAAAVQLATANLKLTMAGLGVYVKEGSNATMGVATLSGGSVVVSTTKVTASSRIFLEVQSLGTVAVPTMIGITARSAGTSFTITSANVADTSVIAWVILEPA